MTPDEWIILSSDFVIQIVQQTHQKYSLGRKENIGPLEKVFHHKPITA